MHLLALLAILVSGLQGTVQQSHIHFAQKGVNGSVVPPPPDRSGRWARAEAPRAAR